MIEGVKTRARDFEQCGEIASVLIKEKRLGRFSPLDLKNNSEQCPFVVHPYTAHYRIFALQKYAAAVLRCDTASVPCIE